MKSRHFWPAAASKENVGEEQPDDPVRKEIRKIDKNLEEKIGNMGDDVAEIKHSGRTETKVGTLNNQVKNAEERI